MGYISLNEDADERRADAEHLGRIRGPGRNHRGPRLTADERAENLRQAERARNARAERERRRRGHRIETGRGDAKARTASEHAQRPGSTLGRPSAMWRRGNNPSRVKAEKVTLNEAREIIRRNRALEGVAKALGGADPRKATEAAGARGRSARSRRPEKKTATATQARRSRPKRKRRRRSKTAREGRGAL